MSTGRGSDSETCRIMTTRHAEAAKRKVRRESEVEGTDGADWRI